MIITRYLASHIHKGAAMVLIILLGLSLFFTLIGELDKVGTGNYGMVELLQYLMFRLPSFVVDYMPLAVLLGCMLSLGNLAGNSELIALQSSGLSLNKLILTVGLSALVLAMVSFFVADFIVPFSETRAKEIRSSRLEAGISLHSRKGVWIKDDNNIIYIERLYPDGNAENIEIYHLDEAGKLKQTTQAQQAVTNSQGWLLHTVRQTVFSEDKISVSTKSQQLYQGNLSDQLLESLAVDPRQMSVSDLNAYISFLKESDLNYAAESLSFWQKIYAPISIVVMGLLAIPFVLGSQRQSNTGQRLMTGILLGLLYVVMNQLLIQLGEQLNVIAFINALLPTLIFIFLTAWLIHRKMSIN